MKNAILWIINQKNIPVYPKRGPYGLPDTSNGPDYVIPFRVSADLVFSSREQFLKEIGYDCSEYLESGEWQLIQIKVPDEFEDWNYIPENY